MRVKASLSLEDLTAMTKQRILDLLLGSFQANGLQLLH